MDLLISLTRGVAKVAVEPPVLERKVVHRVGSHIVLRVSELEAAHVVSILAVQRKRERKGAGATDTLLPSQIPRQKDTYPYMEGCQRATCAAAWPARSTGNSAVS